MSKTKGFLAVRVLCLFAGGLVFGGAGSEDKSGLQPHKTAVFVSGKDGYHTYRIPALLVTKKGTLLAFCEGRKESRSDSGDIDMLLKRSEDGGRTWSKQLVVWDDKANTCGNPCAVVEQNTGTIWLLMTWNRRDDYESRIKKGTSKGHTPGLGEPKR